MADTPKKTRDPDEPPLLVELTEPVILPPHPAEPSKPSMDPTTTAEQDRSTLGQRHINLIWETTQMRIAYIVMVPSVTASFIIAVFGGLLNIDRDIRLVSIGFLFGMAPLVIGFYFGRTNHTKTGGVGPYEVGR